MSCISVVTPTLGRPAEIGGLVENLSAQTVLPVELVVVDGAEQTESATEDLLASLRAPFQIHHLRRGGGTALQRNEGIELARGELIALIDDDIRPERDFFEQMIAAFDRDLGREVGGITGYITNQHLDPETSPRWRWYRRLHLFSTYEPGRYDWATGYPINRYLQPPHDSLREIDFMGAGCAVWRQQVFAGGLRFAPFFTGYGILEDAHFALRAGRSWRLLENGRARCVHLRSEVGRVDSEEVARKSAVNYRYVFTSLVPERTWMQEARFWSVQGVDLCRMIVAALRHPNRVSGAAVAGKLRGIWQAVRLTRPEGAGR